MRSTSRSESLEAYSTAFLLNTATIREVNSTEIEFFLLKIVQQEKPRITCHCSAELQKTKQTLTNSKYLSEFTYSDFPCHLKVNRDKLVLMNRQWKFKREEVAFDHYRWFTHENWPICLCLFRYATSRGVVWLDCRGTKHQSSGPEAKAGTPLRDHCRGGAMETDAKPTSGKRGVLQAAWG